MSSESESTTKATKEKKLKKEKVVDPDLFFSPDGNVYALYAMLPRKYRADRRILRIATLTPAETAEVRERMSDGASDALINLFNSELDDLPLQLPQTCGCCGGIVREEVKPQDGERQRDG
jgi:hypothetical protein